MFVEDYGIWIGYHDSGLESIHWQRLKDPLPKAGRYVIKNMGERIGEVQAAGGKYIARVDVSRDTPFGEFQDFELPADEEDIRYHLYNQWITIINSGHTIFPNEKLKEEVISELRDVCKELSKFDLKGLVKRAFNLK